MPGVVSHKSLVVFLIILGLAIYILSSIYVVGKLTKGEGAASTVLPWEKKTPTNPSSFSSSPSPSLPISRSPTPTPLQGPGQYACAPTGDCTDYSDEIRKTCPKTFADRSCLNQCGSTAVRCGQ